MENKTLSTEHSPGCPYAHEAMKYARMDIGPVTILIDATEVGTLFEAIEMAKEEKEYFVFHELDDTTPLKLVYGAFKTNLDTHKVEDALMLAKDVEGCSFLHIDGKNVYECSYEKIWIFPELAENEIDIPFAALMHVPFSLENVDCAKTVMPNFADFEYVCEQIMNRPFLLACREEDGWLVGCENLDLDMLLKNLLNKEKMLKACKLSAIVLNVDKE